MLFNFPAAPRGRTASVRYRTSTGWLRKSRKVRITGAGALLRNHLEETALPSGLRLAFLTTKKLD